MLSMKAGKSQQEAEKFLTPGNCQLLGIQKQKHTPQDERANLMFPLKMMKGQRTVDDVNTRQSKIKAAAITALNTTFNTVKITNRNSVN